MKNWKFNWKKSQHPEKRQKFNFRWQRVGNKWKSCEKSDKLLKNVTNFLKKVTKSNKLV